MPLINFFKKKKPKKEEIKEVVSEKKETKEEKSVVPETKTQKKKISIVSSIILKSPHVTEKASDLLKKNQYVFKVAPKSNKLEIKEAVENIYGVNVLGVRIINIPKKQRRLGRQRGWTKGYKKAIVKLKEGQKIEVLPR